MHESLTEVDTGARDGVKKDVLIRSNTLLLLVLLLVMLLPKLVHEPLLKVGVVGAPNPSLTGSVACSSGSKLLVLPKSMT